MNSFFKNTYEPSGKRIAILCLKQGSKKDGIFFYAHDLIDGLGKRNTVTVISNQIFYNSLKEATKSSIKHFELPFIKNRFFKWPFLVFFIPFYLIKEKKFDEIVFTTEDLPILSLKFFRSIFLKKMKISVVVHDLAEYYISRYGAMKDLFRRLFVKKYIQSCDEVITVSKKTKSDIISLGFKHQEFISLFYNQIDLPSEVNQKSVLDYAYVLYVSGFDYPSKNHIGLLNMINKFDSKKFPYRVVCAGNADVQSKNFKLIESKVQEYGLAGKIVLMPNVEQHVMESLYSNCEFTIFPSLYEGFGRPIVESILFGKKVYSSDVGIFRELGGHPLVFSLDELKKVMV